MNSPSVELLKPSQLVLQPVIVHGQVLVLVKQIIHFELSLGERDFLPTEFVLEFDEFVLKLDPAFAFVVQVDLHLFLGLSELMAFVL